MIKNKMVDMPEYDIYFKTYIEKNMDYEIFKKIFENFLIKEN